MNDEGLTKASSYQVLKKSTYWLLVFCFVLACNSDQQPDQTVYVTETGSKFHRDGCRYLKFSRKVISLKEAEGKGFEPCKVCKPKEKRTEEERTFTPPQKTSIPDKPLRYAVRCSHKNTKGIQCKRLTKNAGGLCWQHK